MRRHVFTTIKYHDFL